MDRFMGMFPKWVIKPEKDAFAGHCVRSSQQVVSDLVLWKPMHGKISEGRPAKTEMNLFVRTPDKHQLK